MKKSKSWYWRNCLSSCNLLPLILVVLCRAAKTTLVVEIATKKPNYQDEVNAYDFWSSSSPFLSLMCLARKLKKCSTNITSSSPSLPLRFICLWRSRSKERKKKKTRKTPFVYLKNRKSSLKQKKKNNKNLKPKEDPKKSHHYWNYLPKLTYLKKLYEKLPGKKTKQTLESNCSLLKLETWNRSLLKNEN